jgi:hypothetical protein
VQVRHQLDVVQPDRHIGAEHFQQALVDLGRRALGVEEGDEVAAGLAGKVERDVVRAVDVAALRQRRFQYRGCAGLRARSG